MHYAKINTHDIANGLGVRVSLFVSGCTHHCNGCFNPETWDFSYGNIFSKITEDVILEALSNEYTSGLTILGGEPFELANQPALYLLLKSVRAKFPAKSIWCYTGYTLERDLLSAAGCVHSAYSDIMLQCIDVLVDGEFQQDKKSLMLAFRGSSNQRIIDIPATLRNGHTVLLDM